MSRTLFLYIFKDLFRIFLMASGALAGIMSFGGLLRPLTREGLDAGQVARMLGYFGPAMTTYSFPVAALFATAVVYGRLSADNELTACKAGGVSLLSLTVSGPALVLGLVVAITSLLFLCFIVPASTLQVEKVIYSNLAKLVQSRIERTHEIDLPQTTIFAQEAHVIPPDASTPKGQQRVELIEPEIISVERDPEDTGKPPLRIPKAFYTASRAFVYIDPLPDGQEVNVTVRLTDGVMFPRRFNNAKVALIEETQYGPTQIPSPIKEDVKFMNVWRLKELYADLSQSAKLQGVVSDFVKQGQKMSVMVDLVNHLNNDHQAVFSFNNGDRYTLSMEETDDSHERNVAAMINGEMTAPYHAAAAQGPQTRPATGPLTQPVNRSIIFRQEKRAEAAMVFRAAHATVHVRPTPDGESASVNVTLRDCIQTMESSAVPATGPAQIEPDPVQRESFTQEFYVPLSPAARSIAGQSISYYESPQAKDFGDQSRLRREKVGVINSIIAESNGRASFAISCLILVMLGSALGMMFRSGNFLTAFAVSFIPALLSITLIIAGQRTAGNLPLHFDGNNNPLQLGLIMIWLGNGINLLLAGGLLWKLGRR